MASKSGKVKFFSDEKGFGFILSDSGDVFVHISALQRSGIDSLREGDVVSYDLEEKRGKTQAVNVTVINQD